MAFLTSRHLCPCSCQGKLLHLRLWPKKSYLPHQNKVINLHVYLFRMCGDIWCYFNVCNTKNTGLLHKNGSMCVVFLHDEISHDWWDWKYILQQRLHNMAAMLPKDVFHHDKCVLCTSYRWKHFIDCYR